ncbi:MAG: LacI family DNA-binding transcriptional regulator [Micropruina sp.]|uniref:LacI family DNA-binding transcriptional regulator n=1 Tax=Micropruina sp. TaxID=2737536 RepID=UPI0039E256F1
MTKPNPDRVTLKMVALAAEMSVAQTSMALNGKPGVAPETRARVLAAARRLGYVPDPIAQELRTGRSAVLALVVRNVANPYFNDILSGMQAAALDHGVAVIMMDSDYSEDHERRHIRYLLSRRVCGLAIAPVGVAAAVEEWRAAQPASPVVLLNSSVRPKGGMDRIAPDPRAVDLAFDHLWGLGHRRIGFLSAPHSLMSDRDRLNRYLGRCRKHRVAPTTLHTELREAAITSRLLDALADPLERPTAVITNSDWSAHYVYRAARSCGLEIGRDLSVVGHDDLTSSELLAPALTTLRLDRRAIGAEVVHHLRGVHTGDHLAPVELVVRDSSGPPR